MKHGKAKREMPSGKKVQKDRTASLKAILEYIDFNYEDYLRIRNNLEARKVHPRVRIRDRVGSADDWELYREMIRKLYEVGMPKIHIANTFNISDRKIRDELNTMKDKIKKRGKKKILRIMKADELSENGEMLFYVNHDGIAFDDEELLNYK